MVHVDTVIRNAIGNLVKLMKVSFRSYWSLYIVEIRYANITKISHKGLIFANPIQNQKVIKNSRDII